MYSSRFTKATQFATVKFPRKFCASEDQTKHNTNKIHTSYKEGCDD